MTCCLSRMRVRSCRLITAGAWRGSRARFCLSSWTSIPRWSRPATRSSHCFLIMPANVSITLTLLSRPTVIISPIWPLAPGIPRDTEPRERAGLSDAASGTGFDGRPGCHAHNFLRQAFTSAHRAPTRRRKSCATAMGRLPDAHGGGTLPCAAGAAARHAFQSGQIADEVDGGSSSRSGTDDERPLAVQRRD